MAWFYFRPEIRITLYFLFWLFGHLRGWHYDWFIAAVLLGQCQCLIGVQDVLRVAVNPMLPSPIFILRLFILPITVILLHFDIARISNVKLINLLKFIKPFEYFFLLELVIGRRIFCDHQRVLYPLLTICRIASHWWEVRRFVGRCVLRWFLFASRNVACGVLH